MKDLTQGALEGVYLQGFKHGRLAQEDGIRLSNFGIGFVFGTIFSTVGLGLVGYFACAV